VGDHTISFYGEVVSEKDPGSEKSYCVPDQFPPGFSISKLRNVVVKNLQKIAFDLFDQLRRTKHPQNPEGES
jgi:hypothetical protein